MKTKIIIFSLFIAVLLLSGCIQQVGGFQTFSKGYAENLNWEEIASPAKECQLGNCSCMVCKKGPSIWPVFSSLAGGYCKFDNECNRTRFMDYLNTSSSRNLSSNYSIRSFMIGQGPSFADYAAANTLCNDKLSMAVQWLIGGPQKPYDDVDPNRAICLLDKSVLPVYILYSNGENIDISKTEQIAYTLGNEGTLIRAAQKNGPVGPVVIVTEMDFNSSNATIVDGVANQVDTINSWCNDWSDPNDPKIYCFVGIAPKIGDYEGLNKVMDKLERKYTKEELSKFVLLAYGLNSHYANASCNGNRMLFEAKAFSQYARNNYSIASIIPYVLIDVGQPDASGTCNWTEVEAVNTYNSIFSNGIAMLMKYGVIGIALYSPDASSFSNPLNCVNCGVMRSDMLKRAWFGNCQKYTTTKYNGSTTLAIPDPLIRFPNNNAADCGGGEDQVMPSFYLHSRDFSGEILDILNPKTPNLDSKQAEQYWTCSSCISERRNLTDVFKNTGGSSVLGKGMNPNQKISNNAVKRGISDVCSNYSELDYYASRFNVDPMLVRALVATESGFDKCAVSKALASGITPAGQCSDAVPGNYMIGYEYIEDPEGDCKFEKIKSVTQNDEDVLPCTYVAFGLMQVLESPYTFWDEKNENHKYFEDAKVNGRKEDIAGANATCGSTFNPFNVSNAACWGTAKLAKFIQESERDARAVALNKSDPDEVNTLKALIGVYKYKGLWDANASNIFNKQWCTGQSYRTVGKCLIDAYQGSNVTCTLASNGTCMSSSKEEACTSTCSISEDLCYYGPDSPKDFIWFVNCISKNEGTGSSFYFYANGGLQVLRYYIWLNSNCPQASCPSWMELNSVLNGSYNNQNTPYNKYEKYYK